MSDIPEVISPLKWKRLTEQGYTSTIDGVKYVLDYDSKTSGTILKPVLVIGNISIEDKP